MLVSSGMSTSSPFKQKIRTETIAKMQSREPFEVDVFLPSSKPGDSGHVKGVVTYIGDGAYNVDYTPTVSDTYTIAVKMTKVQEIQTIEIDQSNINNCGEEFSIYFWELRDE